MKFGVMVPLRNPVRWHKPFPQLYAEALDLVAAAEDLGYDSVWLSEHHFAPDGYCPSPLTVAAAIAARTRRIAIGTCVLCLPFYHPVRVAEDAAIVDILSRGRFILGVGRGYRRAEFEGFGLDRRQKLAVFVEALEVVRRCWTEEVFSHEGQYFRGKDIRIAPRPVQQPHPPILLGSLGEKGTRLAAQLGYPMLVVGGPTQYRGYVAALREAGRDPSAYPAFASRALFVADDPERTWQQVREHVLYQAAVTQEWRRDIAPLPWERDIAIPARDDEDVRRGPLLVGTPEEWAEEIRRLGREMRLDTLILTCLYPGMDPRTALASLETFARRVMPLVRATAQPASAE